MPLGLQMTTIGSLGAENFMMGSRGAIIEDYFWEIASAGNLRPLAAGDVIDIHDTWDLDGTDYKPKTVVTVKDEGYWDVHTISSGNDGIKPLDV